MVVDPFALLESPRESALRIARCHARELLRALTMAGTEEAPLVEPLRLAAELAEWTERAAVEAAGG